MPFKNIELNDATAHQRLIYARDFLNLDLDEASDDVDVISAIRLAQPGSTKIFIEEKGDAQIEHAQAAAAAAADGTAAPELPNAQAQAGSLGQDDPRIVINIPVQDTQDGLGGHDVPVGVNGRVWQLQRGHDLNVPLRVAEALGLTDQDIVRHSEDGDVIVTKSRRIPFSVVQAPSLEEVQAWRKRTDGIFCP